MIEIFHESLDALKRHVNVSVIKMRIKINDVSVKRVNIFSLNRNDASYNL